MLLQIETTHQPATDLGYLLHKNPARIQTFRQTFGKAHVFYPCAEEHLCRVALLLEIDPVGLVRKRTPGGLDQYVNDRPYVASSFLSVALKDVFGTAMTGRSKDRQKLADQPIPLKVTLDVAPVRGGLGLLTSLFEPLGYRVQAEQLPLDERFPDWGDSRYFRVTLEASVRMQAALEHLYVLLPVLDNDKHYWVGEDEVDKLVARGGDWLRAHPAQATIARRYLKHQGRLTRDALTRISPEEQLDPDGDEAARNAEEEAIEKPISLNEARLQAVLEALKESRAGSVVDLGCGEGKLLRKLLREKQFRKVVGVDVSLGSLQRAESRLRLEEMPEQQRERIRLLHGSLLYRDQRLEGFDAAACVEVIEHLDPPRLSAFEQAVFAAARPRTVVITTPNQEYNGQWPSLPAGSMRHRDHRFEWTREEFQRWSRGVAEQHGYQVRFGDIGPVVDGVGAPTQMGVFER